MGNVLPQLGPDYGEVHGRAVQHAGRGGDRGRPGPVRIRPGGGRRAASGPAALRDAVRKAGRRLAGVYGDGAEVTTRLGPSRVEAQGSLANRAAERVGPRDAA